MVGETEQRWGGIDVLVHNALIPFDVTSFADLSWEQLGGKLDRELRAAFLVTKAVVPGMISRSYGRLVYLSTGLSRRPREGMITLGTAKAALDQFVRYVALELAPHGITANLVAPATVDETKVTEQLTADQVRQLGATNPMGRSSAPTRWPRTVAFLASEDSGFTTGHYLPVNGGLCHGLKEDRRYRRRQKEGVQAMYTIDLAYVGRGIHEELVAYVADQEGYYEDEGVHVAIRDGVSWDTERLRRGATIGLGRALLSRLTDGIGWKMLSVNTHRPLFWFLGAPM